MQVPNDTTKEDVKSSCDLKHKGNHTLAVINSEMLNDVFPDPFLTPPAGVVIEVEEKEMGKLVAEDVVVVGAEEKEKRLAADVVSVEEENPMEAVRLLLNVGLVAGMDDMAREDEDERRVWELSLTVGVKEEVVVVGKGTVAAEEGTIVGTAEVDTPQPTVTVDNTVTVRTTLMGSTSIELVIIEGVAVTVVWELVQDPAQLRVIVGTKVVTVD
ncbi:hypothetical protein C0992_008817 [Termitomyces sp. T32_za158]|nr:hypothetical protein C0992_008817 [Termitomyces sp. T32_za158]